MEQPLRWRLAVGTFALRKHNLLQAMLAVEDISYLATPEEKEQPPFQDAVIAWLDDSHIRYTPDVSFTGLSGYGHRFDFVIPKSQVQPERVLRAFNRPNRTAAQTMAFSWVDTKKARASGSSAYAILNDSERSVPEEVLIAMQSYEVKPLPWSNRGAVLEELVNDHGLHRVLGRGSRPRVASECGLGNCPRSRHPSGRRLST